MRRPDILIIGPSAPPYNGMTLATELVTQAIAGRFTCVRVDTADRRGLANVGKLDLGNVVCALRDGFRFLWILLSQWPRAVYVPIAQAWLPFLRDCLFLIPARLTRRAVILHLHGSAFNKFYQTVSPVARWMIRYAMGKAVCGIVLGQNVQGVFEGIIPAERIQIVPNGIPDHFGHQLSDRGNHFQPVLLFLGTLMGEKGFLDVVRALPQVRECVGNIHCVFAGEWYSQREKKTAGEIVETFGLAQTVEFVGPVGPARKYELLSLADLFVFPSANEGQPYVILEAMSAGLPVIATKVGCIPEMVKDGRNGFLIEPGDVQTLARRISALIADPVLRKRMGEESREEFLKEFRFDIFAQRISTTFSMVLQRDLQAG